MIIRKIVPIFFFVLNALILASCSQESQQKSATSSAVETSPYILKASIHDLMDAVVDPAADFLWESVYTVSTMDGYKEIQPQTDEEWAEVRRHAITLIEASNLLMMPGRHVVNDGQQIADEGTEGNLTPEEIQKLVDDERLAFVAFAQSLNATVSEALEAIDNQDASALFMLGGAIDEACEACHTKYWYPNAVVFNYGASDTSN